MVGIQSGSMAAERISRRTIALGFGAGTVHAALALWLGAVVRSSSVWAWYAPETPLAGGVLAVTVAGLILLGGVPVVLLSQGRLVTPLVALVVLFAWAFYRSWRLVESGYSSIGFQPDALFGLLWFVPLTVVLALAAAEHAFRRALGNGVSNDPAR